MDTRFSDIVQLEAARNNAVVVAIENVPGMVSVVLMTPSADITVDELEVVSRGISRSFVDLYGEDELPAFEVTSPGLDRVLKTRRELELFAGRLVRVTTREAREPVIGTLGAVDDTAVHVTVLGVDRTFVLHGIAKISLWDEVLGGGTHEG